MNNMVSSPSDRARREPLGKTAKSLAEQLAERILEDIISGSLPAGERLREVPLAKTHAVGRATVREALISLSRSGYIEQIPRFGARVAAFAKDDVFNLFEIRGALLGAAARACALDPKAPRAEFAELVGQIETLAADPEVDADEFAKPVVAAQMVLIRAGGNPRLRTLYDHLSEITSWRLIRSRATSFQTPTRRRECATDWRRIEDAIRRRDGDAAVSSVRIAFEHASAAVRTELQGFEK